MTSPAARQAANDISPEATTAVHQLGGELIALSTKYIIDILANTSILLSVLMSVNNNLTRPRAAYHQVFLGVSQSTARQSTLRLHRFFLAEIYPQQDDNPKDLDEVCPFLLRQQLHVDTKTTSW